MRAIAIQKEDGPPPGTNPNAKHCLVTFAIPCPICDVVWRFQFRQYLMKPEEEIDGLYRVQVEGKWIWKIDTSKWAKHGLCGDCKVNSKATLVIRRPGQNAESRLAWTEADEAKMRGRQKHQQDRYAATVTFAVEKDPKRPLLDEQKARMSEILPEGRNTIFMSMKSQ